MRVIGGTAKGHRLLGPTRGQQLRPVLDQVKEAIFNILFDVSGLDVLDCFAGTGAMGIEALSRGAARALFVDIDHRAIRLIRTNLTRCRLFDQGELRCASTINALRRLAQEKRTFDLIFVDPPYEKGLLSPSLAAISAANSLRPKGIIICEHHPKEPPLLPSQLILTDLRKYGQTHISFIRYENSYMPRQF